MGLKHSSPRKAAWLIGREDIAKLLHPAGAACEPQQIAGDAGWGSSLESKKFQYSDELVRQ